MNKQVNQSIKQTKINNKYPQRWRSTKGTQKSTERTNKQPKLEQFGQKIRQNQIITQYIK